jgi:hypothetical protein
MPVVSIGARGTRNLTVADIVLSWAEPDAARRMAEGADPPQSLFVTDSS